MEPKPLHVPPHRHPCATFRPPKDKSICRGARQGRPLQDTSDDASAPRAEQPAPSTRSNRKTQRIESTDGFWWFVDEAMDRRIPLEPIFQKCRWKLGRLCKTLGLERRTFARMVKHNVGIPGKKWLRQLRVVVACRLIREGMKIKAVANHLGFRDDSDFAREFRDHMEMSPSAYRKSERSRAQEAVASPNPMTAGPTMDHLQSLPSALDPEARGGSSGTAPFPESGSTRKSRSSSADHRTDAVFLSEHSPRTPRFESIQTQRAKPRKPN
jgi:AraC-like DNA-binding protein